MIRDAANDILNLLKNGSGLKKEEVIDVPNSDVKKITAIILNECRCSMADRNGGVSKEITNADMVKIRNVITNFLSDSKELKEELVLSILTRDEIIGPFIKLKYTKEYDEAFEKFDIDIEEPFDDNYKDILGMNDNNIKERVMEEVIKPYVKNIIHSDRTLSSRDKIGAFFDKNFSKQKDENELISDFKGIISDAANVSDSKKENTANYILKNIMENRYFKNKIIDNTIKQTDLQILGRKHVDFSSIVNSMSLDTYELLTKKDLPNRQINEIKQIYYDMITQLIILSTDFGELTKSKIEGQIKQINKGISSNFYEHNKRYVNPETGYRSTDTSIEKEGKVINFVRNEDIDEAMKNLVLTIKKLLKDEENMDTRKYVREVTRISYRLVRISPFIDGNIRTSKAVANILLQNKDMVSYLDKEGKDNYIDTINRAHLYIAKDPITEKEYMENLVHDPDKCIELENYFLETWV